MMKLYMNGQITKVKSLSDLESVVKDDSVLVKFQHGDDIASMEATEKEIRRLNAANAVPEITKHNAVDFRNI